MTNLSTFAKPAEDRPNPAVVFFCDDSTAAEAAQLDLACRYYGLELKVVATSADPESTIGNATAPTVLFAVHAASLAKATAAFWPAIQDIARKQNLPIAIVGIAADHEQVLAAMTGLIFEVHPTPADAQAGLWIDATEPSDTGYELRGVRLALGPGSVATIQPAASERSRILGKAGVDEAASLPTFLRVQSSPTPLFLLARTAPTEPNGTWQYRPQFFGELAPVLMLVREAGGPRCWHPACQLANLTIDDPWLTEPYGSLSFPGLLREMQTERFHATIGHIPWNYQRYEPNVVALFRANPDRFSLAVHGNNHDRYEFFRYEARPGDQQHPKPKTVQAFNIRQAMARMEAFEKNSGLSFDRVMVFPHGICPGPSIELLKHAGFWATFNYHNVPLDEKPPADPAYALRSVYTKWFGFPTIRRNYPHNYVEPLIAIDLFLGNPTLFMAHQDTFFEGIDAFTPVARRVNTRQPGVTWTSLGEISRRYHLLRWFGDGVCEVRLFARHASVKNPKSSRARFHLSKYEPSPEEVARVTLDGAEIPWTVVDGDVQFSAEIEPSATATIEIHYKPAGDRTPPPLQRSGARNFALRGIADFRDLFLPRSFLGRLLTKKYYRPGKKRPTIGGMLSRVLGVFRRR